jgi:hypothetical protein
MYAADKHTGPYIVSAVGCLQGRPFPIRTFCRYALLAAAYTIWLYTLRYGR